MGDAPAHPTRAQITEARRLVAGHVRRTPVLDVTLDDGRPVTLKLEQLQHTGSFKPRGAFHSVLSAPRRPDLLVAASGGNHGLAVAHVGRSLGIPVQVFVPATAPAVKVARLHALGAQVHQVGERYAEALEASAAAAAAPGALAVHAYDGLPTVTGQGTLAAELEEQTDAGTVLVAVGGGGLIGGVASWWAGRRRIVAVEPHGCPTMHTALAAGWPVPTAPSGLAADSLGATVVGQVGLAACRAAEAVSVLVGDDDIAQARQWLWRHVRVAAEPGGATALAALLSGAHRPDDAERVCVIVCGANASPADLTDVD
ncbi:threonine/serine dehydratase [Ornithinimicrobium sediminis]|uniref:threonine/serine dehydratase n=1 Tax=Ornithinimicrobium sediminis TaxID=2904603 RepID=UPI001E3C80A7|nr:threonine/serine dehydratase [Ornithinimicrobium sediminis]MCE0486836.1 threonine/serine dehydratase [Ornithinimicrobium sediminis]